jgi:hypothetical protein
MDAKKRFQTFSLAFGDEGKGKGGGLTSRKGSSQMGHERWRRGSISATSSSVHLPTTSMPLQRRLFSSLLLSCPPAGRSGSKQLRWCGVHVPTSLCFQLARYLHLCCARSARELGELVGLCCRLVLIKSIFHTCDGRLSRAFQRHEPF